MSTPQTTSSALTRLLPTERGRVARTLRLIERGETSGQNGNHEEAKALLEQAVDRARELAAGEERDAILARALEMLGESELALAVPSQALGRISEIRELGQEPHGLFDSLRRHANWELEWNGEQAGPVLALAHGARRLDRRLAWPHATLGKVAFGANDFQRAAHSLGHARKLAAPDRETEYAYQLSMGELAFARSDMPEAAKHFGQALNAVPHGEGVNGGWPIRASRAQVRGGCAQIGAMGVWPELDNVSLKLSDRQLLTQGVESASAGIAQWADPAAAVMLASGLLCLDRHEEALHLLEEQHAAEQDPRARYLHALALWGCAERGATDAAAHMRSSALVIVQKLVQGGAADAPTLALLGALELSQGHAEAACASLEAALQQRPAQRSLRRRLGRALFSAQRFAEAVGHLDTDGRQDALLRARCLHKTGAVADAIQLLEDLQGAYADDGEVFHYYGCALAEAGQRESALDALTRATELGRMAACRERGHLLAAEGKWEQALSDYSAALEADPSETDLKSYRAWARLMAGQHDEALGEIEALIGGEDATGRHLALQLRGMIYEAEGNHGAAVAVYEQALALADREPGLWSLLLAALAHDGRHDAVVGRLEEALESLGGLDSLDPDALLLTGAAATRKQNWDVAVAVWDAWLLATKGVASQAPQREAVVSQVLACRERGAREALLAGDLDSASRHATAGLAHRADQPNLLVCSGLSLMMMNRAEEALEVLDRALPVVDPSVQDDIRTLLALARAAAGSVSEAQQLVAQRGTPLVPKLQVVFRALFGDWTEACEAAKQTALPPALLPFLGAALLGAQNGDAAAEMLRDAGQDPFVEAQRVLSAARAGEWGHAAETLGGSLDHTPEHPPTQELRARLATAIVVAGCRNADWSVLAQGLALADRLGVAVAGIDAFGEAARPLGNLYRGLRVQAIEAWEKQLAKGAPDGRLLHNLLLAHLHWTDELDEFQEAIAADCQTAWRGSLAYGFALAADAGFWEEWISRRTRATGLKPSANLDDELRSWLADDLLIHPLETRERDSATLGERHLWHTLVKLAWREKLVAAALAKLSASDNGAESDNPTVPIAGPEYLARIDALSRAVSLSRDKNADSDIDIAKLSERHGFLRTHGALVRALLGPDWEAYVLYLLGHAERAMQQVQEALAGGEQPGTSTLRLVVLLSSRVPDEDAERAWIEQHQMAPELGTVVLVRLHEPPSRGEPGEEVLALVARAAAEQGVSAQTGLSDAALAYQWLDPERAVLTLSLPAALAAPAPALWQERDLRGLQRLGAAAALDMANTSAARTAPPNGESTAEQVKQYAEQMTAAVRILTAELSSLEDESEVQGALRNRLEEIAMTANSHLQIVGEASGAGDPLGTLDAAIQVLEDANKAGELNRVPQTLAEHYDAKAWQVFPSSEDKDTDAKLPALDAAESWAKKARALAPTTIKYKETLSSIYNRRGAVHLAADRASKAAAEYTRALEISPENAVMLANRSDAYANMEDWERVEQDLLKAAPLARSEEDRTYVLNRIASYSRAAGVSKTNAAMKRFESGYGRDIGQTLNELRRAAQHLHLAREATQKLGKSTARIDQDIQTVEGLIRQLMF